MRFQTFVATCGASFLLLPVLAATTASAGSVLFDSLGGVLSGEAYAGWMEPVISGTFTTEAVPVRVSLALSLRDYFPKFDGIGDTYSVGLDGGIPLSELSYDPMGGLNYVNVLPLTSKTP